MACGCGRRAGSTLTAGGGTAKSYTYQVTSPSGEDLGTYLTPLEAKREVRRPGGGTIVRKADTPPTT